MDPSDQASGGNLALAWGHQGSLSVPCVMLGDRTAGCTWGASDPTSPRAPGGTGLAPVIGSETGSHILFLKNAAPQTKIIKHHLKTKNVIM